MARQAETEALVEQLRNPVRGSQALITLMFRGQDSVAPLVAFLRSTKPSSLPEPRLLAVEGLSVLKGEEALDALIGVASQRLAEIGDPAVRLGEEMVASRAAAALADFSDPRAHEALLRLLDGKPLVGVAEAFEKLKDPRALPRLVFWLEEDFVAEAAATAIGACGQLAVPPLVSSLGEKHMRHGVETGMSQRRRARILEVLHELAPPGSVDDLEHLLDDPVETVRWNAVRLLLSKASGAPQRRAFRAALLFLDSSDGYLRAECQELLASHLDLGLDLIEHEITRRRMQGESEEHLWPRESALVILLRICRQGGGQAK
jgi:HEAT repeat protein